MLKIISLHADTAFCHFYQQKYHCRPWSLLALFQEKLPCFLFHSILQLMLRPCNRTSPVSCGTRTGTEDANAASVTGPARQLRRLVLLLPPSQSWLRSISFFRKPICARCGQLSLLDLTSRGTKAFAAFTSRSSA
jgi:hypothetical protein